MQILIKRKRNPMFTTHQILRLGLNLLESSYHCCYREELCQLRRARYNLAKHKPVRTEMSLRKIQANLLCDSEAKSQLRKSLYIEVVQHKCADLDKTACKLAARKLVNISLQQRSSSAGTLLASIRSIKSLTLKGEGDFGEGCHSASTEPYFYEAAYQPSQLRILRAASTHFTVLRTFLHDLHCAISSSNCVLEIDEAHNAGNYHKLMKILNIKKVESLLSNDLDTKYEQSTDDVCCNSVLRQPDLEVHLTLTHVALIAHLDKEIDDFPEHMCCSCERLHQRKSLSSLMILIVMCGLN